MATVKGEPEKALEDGVLEIQWELREERTQRRRRRTRFFYTVCLITMVNERPKADLE
jgi:hypothetical protein